MKTVNLYKHEPLLTKKYYSLAPTQGAVAERVCMCVTGRHNFTRRDRPSQFHTQNTKT